MNVKEDYQFSTASNFQNFDEKLKADKIRCIASACLLAAHNNSLRQNNVGVLAIVW